MVSQHPTPWLGEFDSTMTWCNSHGLTPGPPRH